MLGVVTDVSLDVCGEFFLQNSCEMEIMFILVVMLYLNTFC